MGLAVFWIISNENVFESVYIRQDTAVGLGTFDIKK